MMVRQERPSNLSVAVRSAFSMMGEGFERAQEQWVEGGIPWARTVTGELTDHGQRLVIGVANGIKRGVEGVVVGKRKVHVDVFIRGVSEDGWKSYKRKVGQVNLPASPAEYSAQLDSALTRAEKIQQKDLK